MEKIDWIIHHVIDQSGPGFTINAHTHGMERYGHMDFQLVFPARPKDILYLLNTMGLQVQNGEIFHDGDMVKGLFEDCDVRLDLFRETGRQVLRLIIPDSFNRFPENPLCEAPYKYQTKKMFEI